MASLEICCI